MGNLPLIALGRMADRFLGRPFKGFEQTGDVVFVVRHTKLPFNDPRYTRTGPDLATKSIRLCAYGQ